MMFSSNSTLEPSSTGVEEGYCFLNRRRLWPGTADGDGRGDGVWPGLRSEADWPAWRELGDGVAESESETIMAAIEGTDLDRKKNESGEQRSCRRTVVKKAKGRDGVQRRFLTDNREANRQAMITYLLKSCPSVVRNPRNGPDPRWSVHVDFANSPLLRLAQLRTEELGGL
ncbi:unnamed protein product [Cuscuta campestris]|uniref:Uncharacterized protein n=1 Tax=Cuscuta campestris TaxID=132261 RepID=A0A484M9G3_9ASTE|nr:unnamed protein product [Cuscuta campestris]